MAEQATGRGFERDNAAKQMQTAMQSLVDRLKVRQWCIEQANKGPVPTADELIKASRMIFDFCCEDIAAWLARYQGQADGGD